MRSRQQDNGKTNSTGLKMMVFEIIAAFVITLSLGSMMHADTRDNRVRVTRDQT